MSCSSYNYYWHEEEDDVYFVSKTEEKVDTWADQDEDWDDDDRGNTSLDGYDWNRKRRTRTSRQPGVVVTSPRSSRSSKTIKSPSPTKTSRPSAPPSRPSRPTKSGGKTNSPR